MSATLSFNRRIVNAFPDLKFLPNACHNRVGRKMTYIRHVCECGVTLEQPS